MNTISPVVIALGVLSPLLALIVGLYLWVRRHRRPDVARLKVLHGLLWILLFISALVPLSTIVLKGTDATSGNGLWVLTSIFLVGAGVALQIRQCKRRLRQKC
jgi:hypothetical protein